VYNTLHLSRRWSSSLMLAVLIFWLFVYSLVSLFSQYLCNAQILLDYLLAVVTRSTLFLLRVYLIVKNGSKKCPCNFCVLFRQLL